MPRVETSIHIDAPPEAVFDFVSDLKRIPEYVDIVLDIYDITEGPTRVGTTYRERAKPGPFEQRQEWRCTEFVRPETQTYEGRSSQMHIVLHKRMTPEGEGTLYEQWTEFEMFPNFRPLGRLLDPLGRPANEAGI
jgi:uncharacterized protein YndB with AHSA1/START domain